MIKGPTVFSPAYLIRGICTYCYIGILCDTGDLGQAGVLSSLVNHVRSVAGGIVMVHSTLTSFVWYA